MRFKTKAGKILYWTVLTVLVAITILFAAVLVTSPGAPKEEEPPTVYLTVPNIIGMSKQEGEKLLEEMGFQNIRYYKVELEEGSGNYDTIVNLSVEPGTTINAESELSMYYTPEDPMAKYIPETDEDKIESQEQFFILYCEYTGKDINWGVEPDGSRPYFVYGYDEGLKIETTPLSDDRHIFCTLRGKLNDTFRSVVSNILKVLNRTITDDDIEQLWSDFTQKQYDGTVENDLWYREHLCKNVKVEASSIIQDQYTVFTLTYTFDD